MLGFNFEKLQYIVLYEANIIYSNIMDLYNPGYGYLLFALTFKFILKVIRDDNVR